MPQAGTLSGKTAVVTGASSGIGRAIAETLGSAGARIVLAGRTRDTMDEARQRIEAACGRASAVVLDVRDVRQVQDLVAGALRDSGRLDIMVNNAGVSYPTPIADADPEEWRIMLETNVLALLVGAQAAIRAMRQCGAAGFIVNISSIAAQRGESGVYGATKHAVNCISSTLRKELENDSIRVVNVMPGAVATNFARNFDPAFLANILGATGMQIEVRRGERLPEEALAKLQAAMQQVLASPEHVADAVLYAVSQPIHVNVAEIVVRPPRQLNL